MSPILDPNREFINKWEMYKLLLRHSIKNVQIPDTKLFSRESLSSMLIEYPLLYIKPIASWGGKDISTIQTKRELLCLDYSRTRSSHYS